MKQKTILKLKLLFSKDAAFSSRYERSYQSLQTFSNMNSKLKKYVSQANLSNCCGNFVDISEKLF